MSRVGHKQMFRLQVQMFRLHLLTSDSQWKILFCTLPFAFCINHKSLAIHRIISETKNKRLRNSYQAINLSGFPQNVLVFKESIFEEKSKRVIP